jgi:cyclic beta-1,2-glucan synthetase
MKLDSTIDGLLMKIKGSFFGGGVASGYVHEEPLRAELFSEDQMYQHSIGLAKAHLLSTKRSSDRLLLRLADNEKVLLEVRNLLTESVKENHLITPAGEWLLYNFYLIEEQIRTAKKYCR